MLIDRNVVFRKFEQEGSSRDLPGPVLITLQKALFELLERSQLKVWRLTQIGPDSLLVHEDEVAHFVRLQVNFVVIVLHKVHNRA